MIVKVSSTVVATFRHSNGHLQHFRNTLTYIQTRQRQHAERGDTPDATENGGEEGKEGEQAVTKIDWESVDVVGGSLKMGISQ